MWDEEKESQTENWKPINDIFCDLVMKAVHTIDDLVIDQLYGKGETPPDMCVIRYSKNTKGSSPLFS